MQKNLIIGILVVVVVALRVLIFSPGEGNAPIATPWSHDFTVSVVNLGTLDQILSPGVYVLHSSDFSLDYNGEHSPESLEPLAEYGSHTAFAEYVETQDGVIDVFTIDGPVLPGDVTQFEVAVNSEDGDVYLSGIQMLVGTNDGIAVINAVPLFDEDGAPVSMAYNASNFDNGTEENTALNSGFEGGQPDPSRGEENVENGIPTDPQAFVTEHAQVTVPVLSFEL